MNLYFFDFDKTLYAYDFRRRLPAMSRIGGVSQYRMAKSWWAAGYEKRAEAGEWPEASEYLDEFADVTGARFTVESWAEARSRAMTRIEENLESLRIAATLGTVSLLSNNPSVFSAALPILAPEVVEILGENRWTSCALGSRKPGEQIYREALRRFDAAPSDAILIDDTLSNVEGAAAVGMAACHFTGDTDAVREAVLAFPAR